jgi:hydrogenase maturation protease
MNQIHTSGNSPTKPEHESDRASSVFPDFVDQPSSAPNASIIILGIGNLLRADEGLGIHAIRELTAKHRLADHVRVVDGGVMGMELLPQLEGCSSLLIVDCVDDQQPPGSIVRLEAPDIPERLQQKLSMHQAGLTDILALLRIQNTTPPRLVIWGVQPATIDWNLELSATVARSFPALVAGIVAELRAWGAILD